jgi:hypothetical protein
MAIIFTAAEKSELAKAITKAACGIAECWDILSQIGDRIGRDWEPEGTSVADIAEHNASDLDNPAPSNAWMLILWPNTSVMMRTGKSRVAPRSVEKVSSSLGGQHER